jgi:hypothetical protein
MIGISEYNIHPTDLESGDRAVIFLASKMLHGVAFIKAQLMEILTVAVGLALGSPANIQVWTLLPNPFR